MDLIIFVFGIKQTNRKLIFETSGINKSVSTKQPQSADAGISDVQGYAV